LKSIRRSGSRSSLEPPPGISIDDKHEIEKRAAEARSGAPGIAWEELKRDLLK
jgi:hypothetical protein